MMKHSGFRLFLLSFTILAAQVSLAVNGIYVQSINGRVLVDSSNLHKISQEIMVAYQQLDSNRSSPSTVKSLRRGFIVRQFAKKNRVFWVNKNGKQEFKSPFFLKTLEGQVQPQSTTDTSECEEVIPVSFSSINSIVLGENPVSQIFLCKTFSGPMSVIIELSPFTTIQDAWVIHHQSIKEENSLLQSVNVLPFVHPPLLGLEGGISNLWNTWTGRRPLLNIVRTLGLSDSLNSSAVRAPFRDAVESSLRKQEADLKSIPFAFMSRAGEKWIKLRSTDFFSHLGAVEGALEQEVAGSLLVTRKTSKGMRTFHIRLELLNTAEFLQGIEAKEFSPGDFAGLLVNTAGNFELLKDAL